MKEEERLWNHPCPELCRKAQSVSHTVEQSWTAQRRRLENFSLGRIKPWAFPRQQGWRRPVCCTLTWSWTINPPEMRKIYQVSLAPQEKELKKGLVCFCLVFFPVKWAIFFSRKTNLSVSKNILCGRACNPFNFYPLRGETFDKSLRVPKQLLPWGLPHPWADKHHKPVVCSSLGEIR